MRLTGRTPEEISEGASVDISEQLLKEFPVELLEEFSWGFLNYFREVVPIGIFGITGETPEAISEGAPGGFVEESPENI